MVSTWQQTGTRLLALLLTLMMLATPGQPPTVPAPNRTPTAQEMPDGLMSAFLAASAQPFEARAEGHHAHSGGLEFTLQAGGLQAEGEGLTWGLTLSGWGRSEQIAALPAAEIIQTASRLEYRRDALTEWYRDTALGLEQGFTLHQPPPGAGPLVLRLDLATDLTGAPDADGRGLAFVTSDGRTLRYDHLRAWDADGAPLEASVRYAPGQVTIQVHDQGATYPLTIDPLIYREQKVIALGAAYDYFGCSVALSGDTALVGADGDDVGANADQGSAYVFIRSGTTWSLQQQLTAADGTANDAFGLSVALAGDTALVGAANDDVGANPDQGSAYVFIRSGTTWTQQAQLTAADGAASDLFGYSVALAGDTALVGARGDDVDTNSDQGSAYVFTRSGTTWTQQAKLTAWDGAADDLFGYSVALAGDTALVGMPNDNVGANSDQGSAYVFTRSGTTWTLQQQLTAADGATYDTFGQSVALSGDTALVGARGDDVGANSAQGSAYVFTRSGTTWTPQAKLTAADGAAGDEFGLSVALAGDTALVGVVGDDVGANSGQGSAYVFTRSGTAWTQQAKLTTADGAANDHFGRSVVLSGNTALVGALGDNVGANSDQGSAYILMRSGTTWTQQAHLTGSDGTASDTFGAAVALAGNTALVGAHSDHVGTNADQGSAYVFTRSGMTWSLQQQLIALDGATGDGFGFAVALAGDTALVGTYGDDVGSSTGQGSAYVFVRSGTTWTQQAQLTAADGTANDYFGSSVALAGDGTTALIGAWYDVVGTHVNQGSAYVFTRSGTTWTQQAHLTAADGAANDLFGSSVALAGDTALVGAYGDNSYQGSAYVFTRSGTAWTQQGKLTTADGAAYDSFGASVALTGDTALVGVRWDDFGANEDQGSAYVFTRSGTTWTQQAQLTAADGAEGDWFGTSVALSGNTALVGADYDDVGTNSNQGSAYVFVRSGTTWTPQAQLAASDGAAGDNFGRSVALSGDTVLVGAWQDDVGTNEDQGSAYVYFLFKVYLPLVLRNTP